MRTPHERLLFLLLGLILLAGCGKRSEHVPPEPIIPAPRPKTNPTSPPTPTNPPKPMTPEGPPANAIEVQFEGDSFADVQVNDTIALRGDCSGLERGRVRLHEAVRYLGKRPTVAAPDLVREYANPAAADLRFRNQVVHLLGVVVARERSKLYLSAGDKPGPLKQPVLPDLTKAPVGLTVTPETLGQDFRTDVGQARTKYQGKLVEITGKVARFASERGRAVIMLPAGEEIGEVRLYTRDDQPWANLAPGQSVTLRGFISPGAVSGELQDCVITNRGPSTVLAMTVDQLADDYGKLRYEEANKKYAARFLLLTGSVGSLQRGDGDSARIQLRTTGGVRVIVEVGGGAETFQVFNLRPGTPVKFCCVYSQSFDSRELVLNQPLFLFE